MSGHRIRVVLDIDSVDYRRLDNYASRTLSGPKKFAAHMLLQGLEALSPSDATKALLAGADAFRGVVLNALNQEAFEAGIHFSDISFSG